MRDIHKINNNDNKGSYLLREDVISLNRNLFEKELLAINLLNDNSEQELNISFLGEFGYLSVDFLRDSNGIVVGDSGYGKTRFIEGIIGQWAFTTSPDNLKVILFKTNQSEYTKIEKLPHMLSTEYQLDKFEDMLDGILDEIEERKDFLNRTASENIIRYNKKNEDKVPTIVLIIDNLSLILEDIENNKDKYDGTNIKNKLISIAMQGRSLGIKVILSFNGGEQFNAPLELLNYMSFKVLLTTYDNSMYEKLGMYDYISKLESSINKTYCNDNYYSLKFLKNEKNAIIKSSSYLECIKVKYITDITGDDYTNIEEYWNTKGTKGKFHNIFSVKLENLFKE